MDNIRNIYFLFSLVKRDAEFQSIIMESTDEILSRLKFLGHIQKGEKLSSRHMILQVDGWRTRLDRTWITPDNRSNTLKTVKEIISRSFEILNNHMTSTKEADIILSRLLIQDLIKSQTGIMNLKSTYADDIKFGCDLDILLQSIIARLSEIRKSKEDLFVLPNETKGD